MNIVVVAGGQVAAWPVVEALSAIPGVADVEVAAVPEPAGRAELDPVLDRLAGRRLVVAGSPAVLGDVLSRLLRRYELGTTPVGVIGPGVMVGDVLAEAARVAAGGVPVPADLVRDDHGGVLVERAVLAPSRGRRVGMRVYADDVLVANGQIGGLTVECAGTGALRADVRSAGRWPARRPPGRPAAGASGRAVQVSCDEARLVVDGRSHPRPVTRRTWWVEQGRWLLLAAP